MDHSDLKPLLMGRHLARLLATCGRYAMPAEPTPRIIGQVPLWYQRTVAVLTLLGLVGGLRMLDREISASTASALDPPGRIESGAHDSGFAEGWTERLHLRLDPFMLAREYYHPLNETAAGTVLAADASTEPSPISGENLAFTGGDSATGGHSQPRPAGLASPRPHRFLRVQATGYTSRIEETDDTPFITASNLPPGVGTIALSRDLLRTFTPNAPFDFLDKVLIPGVGIFEVRDTMHPRWTEKADLWFTSVEQARAWGRRTVFLTRIHESAETIALHLH